jgi:hypothetical protein
MTMRKPVRLDAADVAGISRLGIEGTSGITDIVEEVHRAVLDNILPGTPVQSALVESTASIYAAVRAVTGAVDGGLDAALSPYLSRIAGLKSTREREAALAAVNGVVGDHLAATENPLAIAMRLRRGGMALDIERSHLAAAIPDVSDRIFLFVHGLCMNDLQWGCGGCNRGTDLASELGWTPVHLHYNTGLHVSTNGRALAGLLENVVSEWPVPVREVAIIGHSCGGLLARSAHFYGTSAGHRWPKCLHYLVSWGPRTMAPRSNAPAITRPCCCVRPLTVLRLRELRASAAQVSPTCGTATWSTKTGRVSTGSRIRPTGVCRCPFPAASGVSRLRPARAGSGGASAMD